VVGAGCVCCAVICDDDDGNGRGNSCWFISGVVWLLSCVAQAFEKIARFLLQYMHKMILTSSAFRNISYCEALQEQKKMLAETKDKFGSKNLLLDNALSQHVTHLILLSSSLGAWITIFIGYPEYAPLIHIAGYLAGRTAIEVIDVILQLWLVIWHLDPLLLGADSPVYQVLFMRTVELTYELDGEKRTKTEIEIEVAAQYQVPKLISGDGNTVYVQNAAVENKIIKINVDNNQIIQNQPIAPSQDLVVAGANNTSIS